MKRFSKRPLAPVIGSPAHAIARDIATDYRKARIRAGLSQHDVARSLGISRQTVTAFERGRGNVHIGLALRMIDHLGLTLTVETNTMRAAS